MPHVGDEETEERDGEFRAKSHEVQDTYIRRRT